MLAQCSAHYKCSRTLQYEFILTFFLIAPLILHNWEYAINFSTGQSPGSIWLSLSTVVKPERKDEGVQYLADPRWKEPQSPPPPAFSDLQREPQSMLPAETWPVFCSWTRLVFREVFSFLSGRMSITSPEYHLLGNSQDAVGWKCTWLPAAMTVLAIKPCKIARQKPISQNLGLTQRDAKTKACWTLSIKLCVNHIGNPGQWKGEHGLRINLASNLDSNLQAVWPWASCFTSLILSYLTCKMDYSDYFDSAFMRFELDNAYNMFHQFSSVQFSRLVVSDSLRPHGLQHTRLPCPLPTPGAYSNSCPLR